MKDKQKDIVLELAFAHILHEFRGVNKIENLCKINRLIKDFYAIENSPNNNTHNSVVEKIEKVDIGSGWWNIRCGEYGWYDSGWSVGNGYPYIKLTVDLIYKGLVDTGNVPEVYLSHPITENKKRELTVADICKPFQRFGGWWYVICDKYEWSNSGWVEGMGTGYYKCTADAIYNGLVTLGNVPKN